MAGEKTEQPTQKKLDEAFRKGQFARSAEVQTAFVVGGGLLGLKFAGGEIWNQFSRTMHSAFAHLHEIDLTAPALQGYASQGALITAACAAPIVIGSISGGLLAGAIQNRFHTATDALEAKWERLNPVSGFTRIFSARALAPALLSVAKFSALGGIAFNEVKKALEDPIFFTAGDLARISGFLAKSAIGLTMNIGLALVVMAILDYAYQLWKTHRDMMMTREEVKDETKQSEGDPHVKARQRRRRKMRTHQQMMTDVPTADVVLTNPTHLAIALKYDRKNMGAPRVVAKGARLNALKIREIAQQHQIPILENKPLARLIFKHVRVGGEIPAQLYAAVAEVLAWVYRVNRYRYYAEQNKV